jgi:hypothetical protein
MSGQRISASDNGCTRRWATSNICVFRVVGKKRFIMKSSCLLFSYGCGAVQQQKKLCGAQTCLHIFSTFTLLARALARPVIYEASNCLPYAFLSAGTSLCSGVLW